ncbi:expressed unknown protein [Seminavis robusta]|uniref:Uncharacterized protein n=1 Tax=Seminavis robusta TaxID=568900 RepID=A0A9N8HVQ3_9STRA|nr:expressed unknown protein [Seminavis robusta]|eukprot:Sro2022_g311540.1 n/a (715) ;mRNA; f:16437-18693
MQQEYPHAAPPPLLELQLVDQRHQRHPLPMDVNIPIHNINPYHRVQEILQAISRTVPQAERHQVLESSLQFLSHEDTALHDYEVDMGADRALCLQLGYLDMLQTSSPTNNNNNNNNHTQQSRMNNYNNDTVTDVSEQILICWCLTRIYQCSREQRLRSFQEIGLSDLVPILTKILKRCISTNSAADNSNNNSWKNHGRALSQHMDMMVPVLRILRIFAKLDGPVKSDLLRWKNGRLVTVLVDILATHSNNNDSENSFDNDNNNNHPAALLVDNNSNQVRGGVEDENHFIRQSVVAMESFGVLKDLSFRLDNNDKEYMYRFLRNTLIQYSLSASCGSNNGDDGTRPRVVHASLHGKLLESVAAMLWNFATAPKLSFEMAQQSILLKSLGLLLQYTGSSSLAAEEVVKIKRNALSAFGNLVAALTREYRGMVLLTSPTRAADEERSNAAAFRSQDWILPTFSRLLRYESDKDIQRRAMRTIRCLAARAWGREFLWEGSDVKGCLTLVLNDSNAVFDVSTRIQACETMLNLTEDPHIMEQSSVIFEISLSQAIAKLKDQPQLKEQDKLIVASTRALYFCLERRPRGQESFFPRPDAFFASLLACTKVEMEATHPPIAQLLLKLATTDKVVATQEFEHNRSPNGGMKTKCPVWQEAVISPPVLDTLTALLIAKGPLFYQSHSLALDVIHHFLQNPSNKKVLAKNAELLSAMVGVLLVR